MSVIHTSPSALAGLTVRIAKNAARYGGSEYRVEDWWDRVSGGSWKDAYGNPACLQYAARSIGLPFDDEVLYGKIGPFGHLIHITEIATDDNGG